MSNSGLITDGGGYDLNKSPKSIEEQNSPQNDDDPAYLIQEQPGMCPYPYRIQPQPGTYHVTVVITRFFIRNWQWLS